MMVRRKGRRSEVFLSKLRICQGKASFHSFEKLAFMSAQLCILDQKRYRNMVMSRTVPFKFNTFLLIYFLTPGRRTKDIE